MSRSSRVRTASSESKFWFLYVSVLKQLRVLFVACPARSVCKSPNDSTLLLGNFHHTQLQRIPKVDREKSRTF